MYDIYYDSYHGYAKRLMFGDPLRTYQRCGKSLLQEEDKYYRDCNMKRIYDK